MTILFCLLTIIGREQAKPTLHNHVEMYSKNTTLIGAGIFTIAYTYMGAGEANTPTLLFTYDVLLRGKL